MTNLTPYEQALVDRVARAICAGWGIPPLSDARWLTIRPPETPPGGFNDDARAALTALGLIGPDRTAWLAPWEATEEMQDDATSAFEEALAKTRAARARRNDNLEADGRGRPIDEGLFAGADWAPSVFAAMRDAHLKEALPIATEAGQIVEKKYSANKLFSGDMW